MQRAVRVARGRHVKVPAITEAEFQAMVLSMAHALGWEHLHVRRSIGKGRRWTTSTNVPWPDLTLWRPRRGGGLLVRELKVADVWQDGQKEVLASLTAAGVNAGVWFGPRDLDSGLIQAELSQRAA